MKTKSKRETYVIEIEDGNFINDLACGFCKNIIDGYDEKICPVCESTIDMNKQKFMTKEELELY